MNSPTLRRLCCLLPALALWTGTARARVGETREELEARVIQPGQGRIFQTGGSTATAAAAAPVGRRGGMGVNGFGQPGGTRANRGQFNPDPFQELRSFLPQGLVEVIYLKSDVSGGTPLSLINPDTCWHLHVLYSEGRSVLEAYERVGVGLSDFEVDGVLGVNKGSSIWKKVSDGPPIETGIGATLYLDDGSLRAKQEGNALLIFATKVDNYILAQQKTMAGVQQTKAPASVQGF